MTRNTPLIFPITWLLFTLIFHGIDTLSGQPIEFKFEYLTPNEGLSQASVIQIIQDKRGFFWFGTRNGLNRYDGYTFTQYYSDPADTNSIPGDVILNLFIDHKDNLWIGTDNGFCMYDRNKDAFINFRHRASYPESLLNGNISYIYQDSYEKFWLGTYGAGLVKFDPDQVSYQIYAYDENNEHSILNNSIHGILEAEDGNLWVATDGGGLNFFDRETEFFTHFVPRADDPKSISNYSIYSIVKDKQGTIWLGTLGDGICRLNYLSGGEINFDRYRPDSDDSRRLMILSMFPDSVHGGLWLGTENGGLDFFNIREKDFYNYHYDEDQLFTLNGNSIQSIYKDKIGNLWLGTYTGGINVNKENRKAFETVSKVPGSKNTLSYNAVTCFYEDPINQLWIGTDGGGLNIYNRETNSFSVYSSKNSSLQSDAILAICSDFYGNIWVAGWGCGLARYDRKNDRFINYDLLEYKLPHNNIFDVESDNRGNIWISYAGDGLVKFNAKSKNAVNYHESNSGLPNNWIFDIEIDQVGNVLIGHALGLSILDPETSRFLNFSTSDSDTNSLSYNLINNIMVAGDSTYWIGTSSGLNHFYPETRQFVRYFTKDGLPNNNVQGIVEDRNRNIWISTNNGISKYNTLLNAFTNYSYADGLQGKGFIRNSCVTLKSGEIVFGGTEGFNIFYPDSLKANTVFPEIVITNFLIFNKPVKIGGKNSPLQKHINECEKIILSHKHSVISFEFAALEYTAPDQNQYAYMLEPFDKDWNEVGTTRTATYTNLDPGEYILTIKASNNDGLWVPEEKYKRLTLIIKPPFYRTIWFIVLMIFFIAGTGALLLRLHFLRLKRVNILLENRVNERTGELQARTLELEEKTELLREKQEEILKQKEKLLAQRDVLEEKNALLVKQQNRILEQNTEIEKHRNELESIVHERTRELANALKRAEESDQLKSAFLANMSHEIRTPMNAIIGFASLLKEDKLSDRERMEFVQIIHKNSESLLVLINDIIDISTIQANQMHLNKEPIDPESMLNHIFQQFNPLAQKKHIELRLNISAIPPNFSLYADELRLTQVISNLVTNSLKFTSKGFVEMGIEFIDQYMTFYVQDTGIGISPANQDQIFERFMKLAEDEKVFYRGTGLGLAISKSLVELWGGKIWFESTEKVGTTFYFTHPISELVIKSGSETNSRIISMPDLTDKTILIAEDEEDNFNLLKAYFSKTGAKLLWAKTGIKALELVRQYSVDLVLMDIKLPEMNGKEATKKIRANDSSLPIIAQTAYTYQHEINEILASGVNDFLIKPIKKSLLAGILKKYL
jgi:signal transduction histidine kinase/ligand-binding sensor domain-containing protein/CheY-like chemotaxis protein